MDIQSNETAELCSIAVQAAMRAGEVLRQGFRSSYQVSSKDSIHNVVTPYDHEAESVIIDVIKNRFPKHTFLAEERGGERKCDSVLWIIDPLDGTLNFVHQIPLFAVSIAAYTRGEVVAGVVFLPMTFELFIAEKGQGAYLNGSRIGVSKTNELKNAFTVTGMPSGTKGNALNHIQPLLNFIQLENPIRDLGSAAIHLAYLAAGRIDVFWIPRLQPWDMAAGKLIVEESGGTVSHYDRGAHQIFPEANLVATNGLLHDQMIQQLEVQHEV